MGSNDSISEESFSVKMFGEVIREKPEEKVIILWTSPIPVPYPILVFGEFINRTSALLPNPNLIQPPHALIMKVIASCELNYTICA